MRKHIIKYEDFSTWINETRIVYASASNSKKKLVASVFGNYEVLVNEEIIWRGTQPFRAVEEYNAI